MKKQLRITQRKESNNGFNLFSSHYWFKNKKQVVFDFDEWGVSIRVAGIDDENTTSIHKNGLNGHTFQVYNRDIQHGILIYDESESDQDQIYFNYI